MRTSLRQYSKKIGRHHPFAVGGIKITTKRRKTKIHGREAIKIYMRIKARQFKEPVEMKSIITGPKPIIERMSAK